LVTSIKAIKSKTTKWIRHEVRAGYTRIAYKILVGEHEGKREPRGIQEDNIEEYLK
jgi:hypothetical protein